MTTDIFDNHCPWSPLEGADRIYVGVSLVILGIIGVLANSWLASTVLMSPLLSNKTHLLLLNLAVTALGRGLLAGFPFAGTSTLVGRWLFGDECCQFFAFLQHFFGISHVATITMLSVERVIVVCHLFSGSHLSLRTYVLGIVLCWTASVIWAIPPLLGWGSLNWTLNNHLPSFVYNMCLLLAGGVLPVVITCVCVWCSVGSEGKKLSPSADIETSRAQQRALTKTLGVLVPGLYLMWLPQVLLILWTLTGIPLPGTLIILAPVSSEASAIVPVLACLACDMNMRRALLGILETSRSQDVKNQRKAIRLKDIK